MITLSVVNLLVLGLIIYGLNKHYNLKDKLAEALEKQKEEIMSDLSGVLIDNISNAIEQKISTQLKTSIGSLAEGISYLEPASGNADSLSGWYTSLGNEQEDDNL